MSNRHSLFTAKVDVEGLWSGVMEHARNERALRLSPFRTRCLQQGEIHEFLVCDRHADTSAPINEIAYLGFGEIVRGGVVEVGDHLLCGDRAIGHVVGFDETHMPNHYNIVVQGEVRQTGAALGLRPLDGFRIQKP